MALFQKYPGKKDPKGEEAEEEGLLVARESAIFRLLKASSLHFGSYAFRSAFFERCLDTNVLQALMREKLPAPGWSRRATGAACAAYVDAASVSIEALGALEAEAFAAGHGCRMPALIFEAHAAEEPEVPLLPEELQLLERSNYGLAYTSQVAHSKLQALLVPSHGAPAAAQRKGGGGAPAAADVYPSAGDEDGLLLQNLWIIPSVDDDPQAGAWQLPLACGIVPAVSPTPRPPSTPEKERLRYKRQVSNAVHAAAVNTADALLIGCAAGIPGTCRGREVVTMEEAATIWADVLRGPKPGATTPVDRCFRRIVFCLGRERTERLIRARRALRAAFQL
eukprot:s1996_g2.t1